jgi:uncharacterized phiE125 gp8 family phage protein
MRHHYSITTAPASEPVTYDEAAENLRVDSESDMEYITALIPVAREMIEAVTGRAGFTTVFTLASPTWEAAAERCSPIGDENIEIALYRTPLVSIGSVKYYDSDNVLRTMSSGDYFAVTLTEPGRIVITGDLPDLYERPDAVRIEFTAGHATAGAVSAMQKHAIKMLVAHLYEERATVSPATLKTLPWSLDAIVQQIKVGGWCA